MQIKKTLALLTALFCLGLTACGAGNDSGKNESSAAGTVLEENTESDEIKDAPEKHDDAILGDNFGKSGSY
ncbi:MAG: hypothetical protein K6B74_10945, partial [Ruminococcus sp.]|nr:hypothetical protein [Ruminococcus sp.]